MLTLEKNQGRIENYIKKFKKNWNMENTDFISTFLVLTV